MHTHPFHSQFPSSIDNHLHARLQSQNAAEVGVIFYMGMMHYGQRSYFKIRSDRLSDVLACGGEGFHEACSGTNVAKMLVAPMRIPGACIGQRLRGKFIYRCDVSDMERLKVEAAAQEEQLRLEQERIDRERREQDEQLAADKAEEERLQSERREQERLRLEKEAVPMAAPAAEAESTAKADHPAAASSAESEPREWPTEVSEAPIPPQEAPMAENAATAKADQLPSGFSLETVETGIIVNFFDLKRVFFLREEELARAFIETFEKLWNRSWGSKGTRTDMMLGIESLWPNRPKSLPKGNDQLAKLFLGEIFAAKCSGFEDQLQSSVPPLPSSAPPLPSSAPPLPGQDPPVPSQKSLPDVAGPKEVREVGDFRLKAFGHGVWAKHAWLDEKRKLPSYSEAIRFAKIFEAFFNAFGATDKVKTKDVCDLFNEFNYVWKGGRKYTGVKQCIFTMIYGTFTV